MPRARKSNIALKNKVVIKTRLRCEKYVRMIRQGICNDHDMINMLRFLMDKVIQITKICELSQKAVK